MAESDTILQLGIEAAREGNREEARNLFSLLTRQEPDNAQAWLWYAGVADGQDERRAALERVVELDPSNEMARRGLQAMGVSPTVTARTEEPAFVEPQPVEPVYADAEPEITAAPAFASDRELTEDERLAAELDMAYEDYDSVEREGPVFRNEPTPLHDTRAENLDEAAVGAGAGGRFGSRRGSRRFDADDADPYARNDSGTRSRPMGLLIGLVLVILLLLCVILAWPRIFGGGDNVAVVNDNANNAVVGVATPGGEDLNANAGVTNTNDGTGTTGLTGTGTLTDTPPLTSTDTLTDTPPVTGTDTVTGTEQPPAPTPEPPPVGDLASANPQPVPVGEQITAGEWSYTFPNFCLGSCATSTGNQIGGFTAQGTYVVALVLVSNNSGTAQAIPANFFVLKDAQGRVHTAQPQVSSAYLIRGVNADISMEDTIQPGAANTSVPLVFDVPSDATDLVLFSSANPNQGFQVLNAVQ